VFLRPSSSRPIPGLVSAPQFGQLQFPNQIEGTGPELGYLCE